MEPAIFLASTMFWGYCLINIVNIDIAARKSRAYLLLLQLDDEHFEQCLWLKKQQQQTITLPHTVEYKQYTCSLCQYCLKGHSIWPTKYKNQLYLY